tara:strand:- start:269 stop:1048 length:780 start_codon:yes stop_codon:yes gene_type:complete
MKNLTKNTVYLFLLLIVFQACKSIAILPTNSPIKNVNIEALASKIRSNYPKVNNVRSRIKATYNNGKRKQQIIVQFRMESKKKLWLSATMIIPIAKLLVTPNKVSFYEKFQKTYFEGNYDLINTPFNTNFVFSDLENIFLGKPFLNPDQGRWKQISNPQYYILIPQGKRLGIKPTLFFDPVSFLLKEQRFFVPGTNYNITIKYLRHIKIEGKSLPSLIEITFFDGNQSQTLELEFNRIDFIENLNFPFEIPNGYSKIKF